MTLVVFWFLLPLATTSNGFHFTAHPPYTNLSFFAFFRPSQDRNIFIFFNNKTDLKGVKPLRGMLWSFELLCINPDLFLGPWYYHLGSSNWVFHSPLPGLYKIYIYIYILSQPKWYFPPSLATSLYFSARQIQLWRSLIKPFRWWSFVINKAWTRDFHVINKVL